jgi:hypothetical protein
MQLLEHGFLPPHTQAFAALRSNGTLQLFGAMELAAFEARFILKQWNLQLLKHELFVITNL